VTIPLKGSEDKKLTVNRALTNKSGQKQLVYYWFPQRGRALTNAYELKLFGFWDALTKRRTDGALVRLITPLCGSESAQQADARLTAFTQDIVPVLQRFIPGKKISG
jgi:EpsI family protein